MNNSFWQHLYIALVWISLPITMILFFLVIRVGRKYEASKRRLKKDTQMPGMEDVRFLLKKDLAKHGIESDEDNDQ